MPSGPRTLASTAPRARVITGGRGSAADTTTGWTFSGPTRLGQRVSMPCAQIATPQRPAALKSSGSPRRSPGSAALPCPAKGSPRSVCRRGRGAGPTRSAPCPPSRGDRAVRVELEPADAPARCSRRHFRTRAADGRRVVRARSAGSAARESIVTAGCGWPSSTPRRRTRLAGHGPAAREAVSSRRPSEVTFRRAAPARRPPPPSRPPAEGRLIGDRVAQTVAEEPSRSVVVSRVDPRAGSRFTLRRSAVGHVEGPRRNKVYRSSPA